MLFHISQKNSTPTASDGRRLAPWTIQSHADGTPNTSSRTRCRRFALSSGYGPFRRIAHLTGLRGGYSMTSITNFVVIHLENNVLSQTQERERYPMASLTSGAGRPANGGAEPQYPDVCGVRRIDATQGRAAGW